MICPLRIQGIQPPAYTPADFPHSPLVVFYEVTQACDLACLHCRACAQPEANPNELSPTESLRLIDQLRHFPRRPMLVLTGGDPLKRADIYSLVDYAARAGLEVSVTPSATPLVTVEAVRRLRDAGLSRLAVSLDGADARTHDGQRGIPGIFNRTLKILATARDNGIPAQVNTTLTPENIDQIDTMAEILQRLNVVMWSMFYLVPVGRAAGRQRLTPQQYEESFQRLWQQSRRRSYAIKTTEAPQYRRYLLEHRREGNGSATTANRAPMRSPSGRAPLGVNDGKGVMFIGHTGLIHPSGFLPIVCGMFPLDHVVHVYQHSPIFQGLRDTDRLEGKCRACEYRNACGGSRARAYAVTGNPFAQDPDCEYIPAALNV